MIILICYRMQATDAWCLYDSFVCERVKKEIRKRKRKTGKQSSVPPFIFIATKCKMMFALKICERWRKIVCVREREREKIREREKEKLQIERESYCGCDEYLYFSWMLRSLSLLNICSDSESVLFEALNFAIRITVTIQIYWFRVIDFLFWATCLNQFKFDTAAASGMGLSLVLVLVQMELWSCCHTSSDQRSDRRRTLSIRPASRVCHQIS